jgi:hypothetical protein
MLSKMTVVYIVKTSNPLKIKLESLDIAVAQ